MLGCPRCFLKVWFRRVGLDSPLALQRLGSKRKSDVYPLCERMTVTGL